MSSVQIIHNRCVSTIFTKIIRFDVTAAIRVHGDVDMYILSRVKVVIMELPVRFLPFKTNAQCACAVSLTF